MTLKEAAKRAIECQDAINGRAIAASMLEAMDAIRAHPTNTGTWFCNQHPIVFMFIYKLQELNGHEQVSSLWDAYRTAEQACKNIIANAEQLEQANFEAVCRTCGLWDRT